MIKQIEYLKRRNKHGCSCSSASTLDFDVIGNISYTAKCRAPYVAKTPNLDTLPICVGKAAIQKAMIGNRNYQLENIVPPCEALVSVDYDYSESEFSKENHIASSTIGIWLRFPERLKVITHRKEISFHALVGNCGGYIGLFLGNYISLNYLCHYILNVLYAP